MTLEFYRQYAELAFGGEDIDSSEYGSYCHWCGADQEDSPEWKEVQAHNRKVLEDAGFYMTPPNHEGFGEKRRILKDVEDRFLPVPDRLLVVNHRPDCPYVKYQEEKP